MWRTILIIGLCMMLIGCSNPIQTELPPITEEERQEIEMTQLCINLTKDPTARYAEGYCYGNRTKSTMND